MPLPRIFRISSRKSLKSHDRTSSEPPPAVPSPSAAPAALPSIDVPAALSKPNGYAHPLTSSQSEPGVTAVSNQYGEQESAAMASTLLLPALAAPPRANGHADRADDSCRNSNSGSSLTKASAPANDDDALMAKLTVLTVGINQTKQHNSKVEKALDAFDNDFAAAQTLEGRATAVLSPIKVAAELPVFSGAMKALEEGMPLLMKGLDEVAKIHPFIGVAVLAFKSVYGLEMTRRSNEKKVVALYVEMKDTIYILLQLKDVRDPSDKGPDGVTIQGRLQSLVDKTAADLKSCGNACDTYSKMRLLTKVIKGPIWDGTLASFATTFTQRRTEFEFALSIHTGRGVDEANRKLDNLSADLKERSDMLMKMMQSLVSPEQQKLAEAVKNMGGAKRVMEDDSLLKELSAQETKSSRPITGDNRRKDDLDKLKTELRADPIAVIQMNLQAFEGKFAIQQRQIVEDIDRAMKRESDRVIELVTSGPHDRIVDKDLYTLWKDMGWRGSVKARHFVLSLRDYYHDREDEKRRKETNFEIAATTNPDAWALEFLNVKRLQQIAEAFDEDASGFITVAEANKLIAARPLDWSLPHWLAYWSIGWHITACEYVKKIHATFNKMFQLKEKAIPRNGRHVNQYLTDVWYGVVELTLAIQPYAADDELVRKFQSHKTAEEERIRKNLESIRFDIDSLDTLTLVTGPGSIERYLFPLLYLLLKRHLEILKIAQMGVLNRDELTDSAATIHYVFYAVSIRYQELSDVFTQQKLDPKQQFKTVYSGLYQYWDGEESFWSVAKDEKRFEEPETAEEESQDVDPSTVLNYPLDDRPALDYEAYDAVPFAENEFDQKGEPGALRELIGRWYCVVGTSREWPSRSMFSVDLHLSADGKKLEGTGKSNESTEYSMNGTIKTCEEGQTILVVTQTSATGLLTMVFRATLTDSGTGATITGVCGYGSAADAMDPSIQDPFILSCLPPEILIHRPSPKEFERNRIKALWQFAISAVRDQVRRQLWSWSYFKARFQTRKRIVELVPRSWGLGRPLNDEENAKLAVSRKATTPSDARFYFTITEHQLQTASVHDEHCDACGGTICGSLVTCLSCVTDNSVDFCDDDQCLAATVGTDERDDLTAPHLPTHSVLKVRKPVHVRHSAGLLTEARGALVRARQALEDVDDVEEEEREDAVEATDKTVQKVKDKLTCVVCKARVSTPCWYCVSCPDDTFICMACDRKDGGADVGSHENHHPLVRVHKEVENVKPVTVEDRIEAMQGRMGAVEGKMGAMEARMEAMEAKLTTLDARVDDGLSRMEGLLHLLLGHFGVSHPLESGTTYPALEGPQGTQLDEKSDSGQEATDFLPRRSAS